eukprot:XP_011681227.1 PREDICTED: uncharacterized protein LOC105446305 [Strongylocentrotus purpuratus]
MNLSSVWHLSELYFHMCIGFVVVGCSCLCECRPIVADEWTFGHVSNHSALDNSEATTTGHQGSSENIHQESPDITNKNVMSDENGKFPQNGQALTIFLSVNDVIKRETGEEEMEDTDTRWSKIKFTLIEVAVFVTLFMNIYLLQMVLMFCRGAQHQAGVIVRGNKKQVKRYTSVNPDSD